MPCDMYGVRKVFVDFGKAPGQHCEAYLFSYPSPQQVLNLFSLFHYRIIGVPSSTCYMLTYDHLLRVVLPPLLPSESLVPLTAGILARTSLTSLMSPLELIRTNLQSTPKSPDNPHTLGSVLKSVRGLVRAQGVQSLWRGLGPTLWRDVPFSGIYWASYEWWKKGLEQRGRSGAWVAFVSGAVSGTSAALITSPFDVLKTRRQALLMSTTSSVRTSTGTLPLLLKIMRTEGTSALFAGILPRTAKIAPACGIMISCFEVRFAMVTFHLDYSLTFYLRALVNSWRKRIHSIELHLLIFTIIIIQSMTVT
jgi:hypothetical protein